MINRLQGAAGLWTVRAKDAGDSTNWRGAFQLNSMGDKPVPIRVMPQDSTGGTTTFDTTFQIDRTQFGLIGGGPRSWEFKVSIERNVAIHVAIAARRALQWLTN